MRDIFFTILVFWVIYRIWSGFQAAASVRNTFKPDEPEKKKGSVSVDYVPPKKSKHDNDDGEYVDYEEVK